MAQSSLILPGAREVSLEELRGVKTPPATASWYPVPHAQVIDLVSKSLQDAGFEIWKAKFGLARSDARLFATLDLTTGLGHGVNLSVGIRNSQDKSLPLSFCAGSRVLVCSNLAFRSELVVARKHTKRGHLRFSEAISHAVQSLTQFKEVETRRIQTFRDTPVTDDKADSLLLRAYEQGVLSHRLLPLAIKAWREPEFEEFKERTLWSLYNAFTGALTDRAMSNPQQFSALTMQVNGLLDAATKMPA